MIGAGPRRALTSVSSSPRNRLIKLLRADSNTVANYQPGVGITGTLNASAWANQIGAAGPLLQATGANQPIIPSSDSTPKAWLPAVAGNTLTSPNQSVTGNQTITFDIELNDYTPAADVTLFDKTSGNDGFAVKWLTTDKVRLVVGDAVGLTNVDVVAASSFTNGSKHTVTIAWADGVGATFSYDGVQSGSQVAAVKTLTNAAVVMTIGSTTSAGKVYRLQVGSIYDLNASDWPETSTNGATQASSTTGEVWTLNSTGATPAQIVRSPQLLGSGAQFMQSANFTFAQPAVAIAVIKPFSYSVGNPIYIGGKQTDTAWMYNDSAGTISVYAGTVAGSATGPTVGTYFLLYSVLNGASSLWSANNEAAHTGNASTNDPGGISLFSDFTGSANASGSIKELIFFNAVPSAAKLARIKALLNAIHGVF